MRKSKKSFVTGILRECNPREKRVALIPSDVKWLVEKGIEVEVESNPLRVFKDGEYKKAGARIVRAKEVNGEPISNDIDLSPEALEKDTILKLLSK